MDYSEGGGGLERLSKLFQDLRLTHPMPVRRVRLLLDWVHKGDYDRIVRWDYLRVGQEGSARDEADAASALMVSGSRPPSSRPAPRSPRPASSSATG